MASTLADCIVSVQQATDDVVSIGERPSTSKQGIWTMSTYAEGLPAPGMRAAGLAVSPRMALAAGTDTKDDAPEDVGRRRQA
jgi:hypothetical protein